MVNRELVAPDDAVEHAQDSNGMRERLIGMGMKLKEL